MKLSNPKPNLSLRIVRPTGIFLQSGQVHVGLPSVKTLKQRLRRVGGSRSGRSPDHPRPIFKLVSRGSMVIYTLYIYIIYIYILLLCIYILNIYIYTYVYHLGLVSQLWVLGGSKTLCFGIVFCLIVEMFWHWIDIYNVGPPVISYLVGWNNPSNYGYLRTINYSYWSYVHQLSYLGGPTLYVYIYIYILYCFYDSWKGGTVICFIFGHHGHSINIHYR